jgi:hypothetical protein
MDGGNVYSLRGRHIGWQDDGVIYDSRNRALLFTPDAKGMTPSRPGLAGAPGMPGFAGAPGMPGFAGAPGRPGHGGNWSDTSPDEFLSQQ